MRMRALPVRWSMPRWGSYTSRAGFVVEVEGGLGEASPLPGRSGEDLATCGRALGRAMEARWDERATPAELAAACADVCAGAPAAAWAVWSALLDARARARGVSVASLLSARPAQSVPLSSVVDGPDAARAAVARGIRTVKIKSTSIEAIAAVRAAIGPSVAIRVDANGAPVDLAALTAIGIEYVEEAAEKVAPFALDETLLEPSRPEWLAAAAFVLKPTVLGPARTLALATMARDAGVAAVLSHALEGPVGLAAAAELAVAIGGRSAVGLDAHPGLVAWKVVVPALGPASVDDVVRSGTGVDTARVLDRARMLA